MRPILENVAIGKRPVAHHVFVRDEVEEPVLLLLGITFVTGQSALDVLRQHNISSPLSRFGWHFEQQVAPRGNGPAFVIEEVFLAGAVEQGTIVPAATLLYGGVSIPMDAAVVTSPGATRFSFLIGYALQTSHSRQ